MRLCTALRCTLLCSYHAAHEHGTSVANPLQLPPKLMHAEELCGQVADIDVGLMVSGISTDEHANNICVASHLSGPPVGIDLQKCKVHPLPSISTGKG